MTTAPDVTAGPSVIRVGLVDLGIEPLSPQAFARRLNRLTDRVGAFHFEWIGSIDIDKIESSAVPKQHYYDTRAILDALSAYAATERPAVQIVLGLTTVPLAHREPGPDGDLQWEYDYFGVWPPKAGGQPLGGPPTAGVLSTALWVRRYEERAYRSTEQYLEHLVVAALGDVLARELMTHARFRRCVFDYNDDLDSIVDSVRRARLCPQCADHLSDEHRMGPLGAAVGGNRIASAMEAILEDVRTPRLKTVLQVLQQDGTFSILILGVLAALGINVLSGLITTSVLRAVVPVVLLGVVVVWIAWQYYRPGPPLRG